MFKLKIDKDLIYKCIDGITFDKGDKLRLVYYGVDGRTVEKVEVVTIKSIEHYSGERFSLTFDEQDGRFSLTLNQLIYSKL